MNRSTAALLIALLLHLLILALFVILGMLAPAIEPPEKEEEHRIRVSLKEMPTAKKEALVKNDNKRPVVAPPMPKGKQLEQLVNKPFKKVPPAPHKVPEPVIETPKEEPKKPEKIEKLPDTTQHIPVKKSPSDRLYSRLMRPTVSTAEDKPKIPKERQSQISQNIKDAYGSTFALLSAGEQKYILDNMEIMRRITQATLNRVASVSIPRELRVNDYNLIEFYLHPNGDISDLRLVRRSGFFKLDDTTRETIEYAYSHYPRPEQKTLIRFKFGYYLSGY